METKPVTVKLLYLLIPPFLVQSKILFSFAFQGVHAINILISPDNKSSDIGVKVHLITHKCMYICRYIHTYISINIHTYIKIVCGLHMLFFYLFSYGKPLIEVSSWKTCQPVVKCEKAETLRLDGRVMEYKREKITGSFPRRPAKF
jgi:hypothetical protein